MWLWREFHRLISPRYYFAAAGLAIRLATGSASGLIQLAQPIRETHAPKSAGKNIPLSITPKDIVDFQQTYFEIFQLPVAYDLDVEQLSDSYLELQKRIHPDNYSSATDAEKRRSLQWATKVNEAFTTLKSPLKRAIYMLEHRGVSIAHNPELDPGFLMSQIELREELEEIGELFHQSKASENNAQGEDDEVALERLEKFKASIAEDLEALQTSFVDQFDDALEKAEATTYKMQFMNKLLVAADQLEEQMLDY